jgi:hypothetical protein
MGGGQVKVEWKVPGAVRKSAARSQINKSLIVTYQKKSHVL